MPTMVFNEWYGEIPYTLNRTIRKYNVSPSDYDDLRDVFGDDFVAIEAAIKQYVYPPNSTQFSVFEFWNRRPL